MTSDVGNGRPEAPAETSVRLDLSLDEARSLKAWLLKPTSDGTTALDDENIKPTLLKIGATLDYVDGVSTVRHELEQAGFSTDGLSDEQVAVLGRRIADARLRPAGA